MYRISTLLPINGITYVFRSLITGIIEKERYTGRALQNAKEKIRATHDCPYWNTLNLVEWF